MTPLACRCLSTTLEYEITRSAARSARTARVARRIGGRQRPRVTRVCAAARDQVGYATSSMRAAAFVARLEVVNARGACAVAVDADAHRCEPACAVDELGIVDLVQVDDAGSGREAFAEPRLHGRARLEQQRVAVNGDPRRHGIVFDARAHGVHVDPARGERRRTRHRVGGDAAVPHPSRCDDQDPVRGHVRRAAISRRMIDPRSRAIARLSGAGRVLAMWKTARVSEQPSRACPDRLARPGRRSST